MKVDVYLSPNELFAATYRLWEWLPHTLFKDEIEDIVADNLGCRWRKTIEEQRFQLNRPMVAVPAIEAAIGEPGAGTHRIAKLLLAAETAVTYRLDPDLRSKLQGGQ